MSHSNILAHLHYLNKMQKIVIGLVSLAMISILVLCYLESPIFLSESESKAPLSVSQPIVDELISEDIGIPVRLKIPIINLDADIENVALMNDGSMAVPEDPMKAGWFELGHRPGEMGSAVIAGHVDWWNGATGVFADLRNIRPGDSITVEDENGLDIVFVVREIRVYDAVADATDVFSLNDGQAHLNLVTCDGKWDKNTGQYSQRLVVFADRK